MGDLIRKYIALDGYVRRYLPIRGFDTMRDTLRHYRVSDAPCFRLVHNAIHALLGSSASRPDDGHARAMPADRTPAREIERSGARAAESGAELVRLCRAALGALPDFGGGEEGELLRDVAATIASRLEAVAARSAAMPAHVRSLAALDPSREHLVATMTEHQRSAADRPPAQQLMEAELGVALLECWTRAARFDLAFAGLA